MRLRHRCMAAMLTAAFPLACTKAEPPSPKVDTPPSPAPSSAAHEATTGPKSPTTVRPKGPATLGPKGPATTGHVVVPWFEGTVEEAFAAARAADKPVFLYWGAVWCPPCNEIKRHVFTRPEFLDLMSNVVPVYLDGDTPEAQVWGERLASAGYPTLLLLSPDRTELMRFLGVVDLTAFIESFKAAIAASRPIDETIDLALEGKATPADWSLLAYFSWMQAPELARSGEDLLAAKKGIADAVPADLADESALLSGNLLSSAAAMASGAEEVGPTATAVRAAPQPYLDALLKGGAASFAARVYVFNELEEILTFLRPALPPENFGALTERWIEMARDLGRMPDAPLEVVLNALRPELEALRMNGEPVPDELAARVSAAARRADTEAQEKYDRQAVISDAAYLLMLAGRLEEARKLLLKEIAQTDTPYYYQSEMADVALREGHPREALGWAEKAESSAEGTATKVEWIVRHLELAAETGANDRVVEVLDRYYVTAVGLPDGFSGRNWRRAKKVANAVRPLLSEASVRSALQRNRALCADAGPRQEARCREHFASLEG